MSLTKAQIENDTRMALLRHRGNVQRVVEEMDLPQAYVEAVAKKLERQYKRDVGMWVAGGILGELKLGRDQRISLYMREFEKLAHEVVSFESACHNKPIILRKVRRTEEPICSRCGMPCTVVERFHLDVVKTRLGIVKSLLEEDIELSKYLERLNFQVPATPGTQELLDEERKYVPSKDVTPDVEGTLLTYDKLSPMDRERVLKRIERTVLGNGEVVADEEENTTKQGKKPSTKKTSRKTTESKGS